MSNLSVLLVGVFILGCWVMNVVKLTNCDFESDYKCEVIHGVGLIGAPVSLITVWFETD